MHQRFNVLVVQLIDWKCSEKKKKEAAKLGKAQKKRKNPLQVKLSVRREVLCVSPSARCCIARVEIPIRFPFCFCFLFLLVNKCFCLSAIIYIPWPVFEETSFLSKLLPLLSVLRFQSHFLYFFDFGFCVFFFFFFCV
jgi:hypothetical protein